MLLRTLIFATLVAGPVWAGCPPNKSYQSVPKVIGLPYPAARAWLIEAGFQPLLDWDRMQQDGASIKLAQETEAAPSHRRAGVLPPAGGGVCSPGRRVEDNPVSVDFRRRKLE